MATLLLKHYVKMTIFFYLTGNKREKCNFYEIMDGKKVCPQGSEGMSSEQAIVVGGFVWFGLLG